MSERNALVFICRSYRAAEKAVHLLEAAQFDVQQVSIIGKDYFDFRRDSALSKSNGKKSVPEMIAFWFRMWHLLSGDAFFKIKGIGSIIAAGPISETIREAGTNPGFFHACSLLRACLLAVGVSRQNLDRYESELQSDHLLIIVHGNPSEIKAARNVLKAKQVLDVTKERHMNPAK